MPYNLLFNFLGSGLPELRKIMYGVENQNEISNSLNLFLPLSMHLQISVGNVSSWTNTLLINLYFISCNKCVAFDIKLTS